MEGNVYRGEERAKSFGSALTHFLRGSVKRAHFATAKLISPFPPRDSLPFFPFSSSLFPFSSPFFGRHNGRTNGRKSTTGEKVFANFGADFYDTRDDRATRKPSDAALSFSSCSFLLIKVLTILNPSSNVRFFDSASWKVCVFCFSLVLQESSRIEEKRFIRARHS